MGKCKTKAIQTDLGTLRHNQAYSIPCINLPYSKRKTCSEVWYIQKPGILKTLAYSKPKAYLDIYHVKHLRRSVLCKQLTGNSFAI